MKEIDILNLEWTSYPSRDRNMATLVCNYLKYNGLKVAEDSVFRGFEMIDKYHPKLLFITNGIGAPINFQLVKYASLKKIKVVTLVSEGNFFDSEETISDFFWGHNKEQYLYEGINQQWSERVKNLILKICPNLHNKIKVSGGVGFDHYKIVPKIDKKSFLLSFKKEHFKQVIGVGCWIFDTDKAEFVLRIDPSYIERFNKDRDDFNQNLIDIIKRNPEILFLLKEHPGNTRGLFESGIAGAEKFPNVLILKKESIVDCIAVSDFWITYESTTVIEAWLLGKQTCLLNPTGIDFPRANVYKGSPNYPDVPTLQAAIDSFYSTHELPGFQAMESERKEVIRETIQWDDGLNHVRAGNEIIRVLKEEEKREKKRIPFDLRKIKWKQYLLSRGIPRKTNNFIYDKLRGFDHEELSQRNAEIYNQQIAYYKKMGLSKENLRTITVI